MFRTPRLGDRVSVALRKLLQEGKRGSQATYTFATKGAGSLSITDQVKEFGILCTGRCRPLGSLHWFLMHLSCLGPILFPCSPCFLHSPSSSAVTIQEAASPGSQPGEPSSHWEAKNRWRLWHVLFINMARGIFISQSKKTPALLRHGEMLGVIIGKRIQNKAGINEANFNK